VEVEQEKAMVYIRMVVTNVQSIGPLSVNRSIIIVKVEVPVVLEVLEELVKDIVIRVVQGVVILAILEAPGLVEEDVQRVDPVIPVLLVAPGV
jgi:accessory colonization factor AcfC